MGIQRIPCGVAAQSNGTTLVIPDIVAHAGDVLVVGHICYDLSVPNYPRFADLALDPDDPHAVLEVFTSHMKVGLYSFCGLPARSGDVSFNYMGTVVASAAFATILRNGAVPPGDVMAAAYAESGWPSSGYSDPSVPGESTAICAIGQNSNDAASAGWWAEGFLQGQARGTSSTYYPNVKIHEGWKDLSGPATIAGTKLGGLMFPWGAVLQNYRAAS